MHANKKRSTFDICKEGKGLLAVDCSMHVRDHLRSKLSGGICLVIRWVGTLVFFCAMSTMSAPLLTFDWASLSTEDLLSIFDAIWATLKKRLGNGNPAASSMPDASSTSSFCVVEDAEQQSRPPLRTPWSCGFRCRWCEEACTRAEGHKHHSCFEHRKRR